MLRFVVTTDIARSPARIARAYLVLPHAVPVVVVMVTTLGCALLVPDGLPEFDRLLLVLGAMFGGQLAIGAVNEIVDADDDAVAKPSKPIPSGLVPVSHAYAITAAGLALMIATSAALGIASLLLSALGTGAGLAYDLWFKRSRFSWAPYLVALPLLPIWVWTALGAFDLRLLWLYPLGGLAVVGVHLAQTLPDIAGDLATGVETVTVRLGERWAMLACWAAILSGPLLASATANAVVERPVIVWIASGGVAGLVVLHVLLYRVRPGLAVTTCFPVVASSVAALGLAWLLALR